MKAQAWFCTPCGGVREVRRMSIGNCCLACASGRVRPATDAEMAPVVAGAPRAFALPVLDGEDD